MTMNEYQGKYHQELVKKISNKMKSSLRLLAGALLLMTVNQSAVLAQDWPQWRGPDRDGKVTGFTVPAAWPQQLKQLWKVQAGFADATPALVNNRLYVFTRQGENEVLQCLDAITGKQLWQSKGYPAVAATGPAASHPGPRSSPAVADGKVITLGIGGDLACFDAQTGKTLWRNEEFKGAFPQFYTSMSPLISSGICVAHLGGPQSGQIVAFDLSSGKVKWKTESEGPTYASPVLLTIDDTKQIVFQAQTKIISLNISDGTLLWELATPPGTGRVQNAASPVADRNKIYYTGLNNGFSAVEIKKEGNIYSVNKLWTNPDISTSYNTPVLKDGFLYGLSNKNRLFCINATNGQTAWADEAPHQNFGSIVDAGSVLIATSSISDLVIFKPDGKAYSQLAVYKVSDNPVYAYPVLSGNRIFIKDSQSLILYTIN
jgi:outer membrane protein assembly factor BamB